VVGRSDLDRPNTSGAYAAQASTASGAFAGAGSSAVAETRRAYCRRSILHREIWPGRSVINTNIDQQDIYDGPGSGWLFFAGTVLGITGIMRFFDALWAFRYDGVVPDNLQGALLGHSLTTYGWVWLIVAVILIFSSFAVLTRSQFARWIGIFAGAVLVITAFWWMPFYPVWSLAYVMIGMLLIYGLAVHGGRSPARR
jgi:hypothetical protein